VYVTKYPHALGVRTLSFRVSPTILSSGCRWLINFRNLYFGVVQIQALDITRLHPPEFQGNTCFDSSCHPRKLRYFRVMRHLLVSSSACSLAQQKRARRYSTLFWMRTMTTSTSSLPSTAYSRERLGTLTECLGTLTQCLGTLTLCTSKFSA
jgi:hypothetical protein